MGRPCRGAHSRPALLCILMGSVGTIPGLELRLDLTRSGPRSGQAPDRSWDVHHLTISPKKPQRTRLGPWRPDFLHVGQVLRGPHSQEIPGAQRRKPRVPPTLRWFIWRRVYLQGTWPGLSARWVGSPAGPQRPPLPPPAQTLPSLGTVGTWDECLEPGAA